MSNFFGGLFFGGGYFGDPGGGPRPSGGSSGSGSGSAGYHPFIHGRTPSEKKRRRDWLKRLGLLADEEQVAVVIAQVAERQVEALVVDEAQRTEELYRELQAEGIEAETRHFKALSELRERLIEEEIGRLMREEVRKRQKAEEEIIDLLLMASHLT